MAKLSEKEQCSMSSLSHKAGLNRSRVICCLHADGTSKVCCQLFPGNHSFRSLSQFR